MGKDSEKFNIIDFEDENIDERQQFCEDYFGKKMAEDFPSGKYFYYWTDEYLQVLEKGHGESFAPDCFILTGDYDNDGIPCAINFYKIED